ncbi:MAG: hypothetical protein KAH13_05820, partial [Tenericutes bacterium]|nr:hypothetical protein [Mycoplasmatota bacterium]
VDMHLVIVRKEEQLFDNVRKRGRDIEKDQHDYLKFHYANYYDVLDRIFKTYKIPKEKILYLEVDDMFQGEEFEEIVKAIEERYASLKQKGLTIF